MKRYRVPLAAAGAVALGIGLMAAPAQAAPRHHRSGGPVVVVSGLNNPRQLALTNHGNRLLIAEAGKGGRITSFAGPEGKSFVGRSGSISAVWFPRSANNWHPHRIVTGLMSAAAKDGSGATGSDGVATGGHGKLLIQETYVPVDLPKDLAAQNGMLLKARPFHRPSGVADITRYERANDPDGYGFDSDPYAVIPYYGGHLVADAAANAVLWVAPWGGIFLFHTFFNVTTGNCGPPVEDPPGHPGCNFVPNTLTTDRWGNVYVGGLSSLTPGEAQVVKLDKTGVVRKTWVGFTSVTGLAVGRHGALFVSQLFGEQANPPNPAIQGVVTRVSASGKRTNMDVPFPTGLALDGKNLYVSAFSIAPASGLGVPGTSGQVWRIPLG